MVKSNATTVDEYLAALDPDKREEIETVRKVILDNLPDGYEEIMQWGMISYVIPLSRFPKTYNKLPLALASLAAQKNYSAVYLNNIYADPTTLAWFTDAYRATGNRMDIGKSCVRFKKLDDLPLELIGEAIAMTPVDDFIERYEHARA